MSYIVSTKIADLINSFQIPYELQRQILEFLDYKFRFGKYIRRIPTKKLTIYRSLLDRPEMLSEGYISLDLNFRDYHNDYVVKTLEIVYSETDRNIYNIKNQYYAIDYDEKRYEYEPSVPW
jgi:hypothetical protein